MRSANSTTIRAFAPFDPVLLQDLAEGAALLAGAFRCKADFAVGLGYQVGKIDSFKLSEDARLTLGEIRLVEEVFLARRRPFLPGARETMGSSRSLSVVPLAIPGGSWRASAEDPCRQPAGSLTSHTRS